MNPAAIQMLMEDPIVGIPKPLMVSVGLYAPLRSLKCFRDWNLRISRALGSYRRRWGSKVELQRNEGLFATAMAHARLPSPLLSNSSNLSSVSVQLTLG